MAILLHHWPLPTSAAASLFVSSLRMTYAIFAAEEEIIVAVYCETAEVYLSLGSGGGGGGDIHQAIACHPW